MEYREDSLLFVVRYVSVLGRQPNKVRRHRVFFFAFLRPAGKQVRRNFFSLFFSLFFFRVFFFIQERDVRVCFVTT